MPAARQENHRVTPLSLPGAVVGRGAKTASHAASSTPESVYYAGPENSLVAAAVSRLIGAAPIAAAEDSVSVYPSPLTLIGPPGCGKSLLASGVTAAWTAAAGDDAVLSLTGVDLRRRYERAIAAERQQAGGVTELVERLAGLRLLVVEDLDGLAESPVTIGLLTSLADRLREAGAALVVTASKPLGEIAGLDTRLVGRLAGGLTLEVASPAAGARRELLVASLMAEGCQIDSAAANDLAAWLPADARRVLAAAQQLHTRFGSRKPITRAEVRSFVNDATIHEASTPLADIAAVAARYYAMPLRTLRSSSRKAPVVLARAVTIYLARQLTPLSYEEIGRYLGGRDHTTVMHNYNRIDSQVAGNRALRSALGDLFRKLGRAELSASLVERTETAP
ncbi:Chromosomal replication initiator protein DnaA [Botrimarina colliarenosi]|uniref:Chromosomal replication initiator protein DnaA n=1 Tax=Botrimarina colliarenosi TaxID=2528001 RepID=A0A5C6AKR3_9BACT|nr:helix-turn-helix domain-containing protein [Botrimarina colliarenosi]TWU00615.1 Chromosomal replication initiator protein DnaA [Botrimarina colliarenosi]